MFLPKRLEEIVFLKKILLKALACLFILAFSDSAQASAPVNFAFEQVARSYYDSIKLNKFGLSYTPFRVALAGYVKLLLNDKVTKKGILTIVDFSLSANEERLWVLDLNRKRVLVKSLVAHGQNTGDEYATRFSNDEQSHMSSLGFYLTANTYEGSKGYSLKLIGLESGINDKAFDRGVVMHGANYVSQRFIETNGRLGRSFGCPAVPVEINQYLCDLLSSGSCFYCYYPDGNYLSKSVIAYGDPQIVPELALNEDTF